MRVASGVLRYMEEMPSWYSSPCCVYIDVSDSEANRRVRGKKVKKNTYSSECITNRGLSE